MREPQHDTRRAPAEQLPPFWIRARDSQGRPIDPRVVAVCEELWPWAYRHVEWELHDPASAAQLVESVALEVSEPAAGRPGRWPEPPGLFHHRLSPPGAPAIPQGKPLDVRGSPQGIGAEPSPHRTGLGGGDGAEVVFEGASSTNCRTNHVTCFTTGFWGSPGMRSAGRFASRESKRGLDSITNWTRCTRKLLGSRTQGCRSLRGVRLMDDKHTRGLPARRAEKRLVKMAGEAVRGDCPNPERIGCPSSDAQSTRLLRGALRSQILTTSWTILQRVPPVSRSTIANGSAYRLRNAVQWCWAARPC